MKTGLIISGLAHLIFLLLLVLGPFSHSVSQTKRPPVTQVSLLSMAEFDAATSADPMPPVTDMTPMQAPTPEANTASAPKDAVAPTETAMDVTDTPSTQDSNPDLSTLKALTQPQVAVVSPQTIAPEVAPQISPVIGAGGAGDSASAAIKRSPVARAAPRVDSFAAPPMPDNARTSDRIVKPAASDASATATSKPAQAEARPESVTKIVPEAQPDAPPSAAPRQASRPARRSASTVKNAKAIAEKLRAQEAADIQAALAATAEPTAAATPSRPAVTMSSGQKQDIGAAIGAMWNTAVISGKDNYTELVVRVAVSVGADGAIIGPVEPVEPANPQGDFKIAFEAARRAIKRAGNIPLPANKYPDGVRLILRFDPLTGIGLN